MDFKLSTRKDNSKCSNNQVVNIPKKTAEALLDLLNNVDCVCVWSDAHQEYLKVHDIDQSVVNDLKNAVAISTLQAIG